MRFKMAINTYLSIITLSVNGLNALIKRQSGRLDQKKKTRAYTIPKDNHFRPKDTHRFKVRGWKKIFHVNRNDKKAGITTLVSDKEEFKTKAAGLALQTTG